MGGFFGIASKQDCMVDVFFGVDYHSHLSARRGGMAAYDPEAGLQREIHNIENSPFRTKFENIFDEMKGCSAIGCISDSDPQPLLVRSRFGTFAITTIGVVNNADALIKEYLSAGGHFNAMTGGKVNTTELIGALIAEKSSFPPANCHSVPYIWQTLARSCLKPSEFKVWPPSCMPQRLNRELWVIRPAMCMSFRALPA